ncbi:hypothetical protein CCACVL1_22669 [Corchorus capsularis]|uniref:Uncharacterized protein n=1 Tax=Corchorus capsularis TaxID=210143 RepID=A0A1R3GX91_COCAP|nr:hypothetical protein CCACVL1_22669 [Corchorus capsularis]
MATSAYNSVVDGTVSHVTNGVDSKGRLTRF